MSENTSTGLGPIVVLLLIAAVAQFLGYTGVAQLTFWLAVVLFVLVVVLIVLLLIALLVVKVVP